MTISVLPRLTSSVTVEPVIGRARGCGRTRRTPGRAGRSSWRSGRSALPTLDHLEAGGGELLGEVARGTGVPEPLSTSTRMFSGGVTSGGPLGAGCGVDELGFGSLPGSGWSKRSERHTVAADGLSCTRLGSRRTARWAR